MLEIKDLTFTYHDQSGSDKDSLSNIVQDDTIQGDMDMCFNLSVNTREILSIIGPSGSGKTTLLNLIAGFNQPLAGEILVNNQDISKLAIAKRPVTTVFQEHNLFPHLDVFTNIAIGLESSSKTGNNAKEQIHQALENVGLKDLSQRLPGQLSGGQRQRVALARTLVRKQEVLLLDEPLAALGPGMKEEIIELIKTLVVENNMAALFVSHQPADALLASRRIAFIYNGQVLEIGDSKNMLENPAHDEIKKYLGIF